MFIVKYAIWVKTPENPSGEFDKLVWTALPKDFSNMDDAFEYMITQAGDNWHRLDTAFAGEYIYFVPQSRWIYKIVER